MNATMAAHLAGRRTVRARTPIPEDVAALLQAGKLEKACPDCGTWEAASFYCSKCGRRSTPAEWYRNGDLTARRATLQMASENRCTPCIRGRGRPRRVSGLLTPRTADQAEPERSDTRPDPDRLPTAPQPAGGIPGADDRGGVQPGFWPGA